MSKSVLLGPEIGKSVVPLLPDEPLDSADGARRSSFTPLCRQENSMESTGGGGKKSRKSPSNIICSFYFFYIFLCILTHLFFFVLDHYVFKSFAFAGCQFCFSGLTRGEGLD